MLPNDLIDMLVSIRGILATQESFIVYYKKDSETVNSSLAPLFTSNLNLSPVYDKMVTCVIDDFENAFTIHPFYNGVHEVGFKFVKNESMTEEPSFGDRMRQEYQEWLNQIIEDLAEEVPELIEEAVQNYHSSITLNYTDLDGGIVDRRLRFFFANHDKDNSRNALKDKFKELGIEVFFVDHVRVNGSPFMHINFDLFER